MRTAVAGKKKLKPENESVGEDKSRINAKTNTLDYSGRMTSDADLHSTVANMWAVSSFIHKDAHKSELWKK
jgi:hypothetical protein